ncbi:hypothetical protein [Leifsonia sp. 2MCAF36]|uniref:hypothetical protein n=1 Tax=Leifsonia sp. 2MCAF36 TaxID=3232988 RepID=UPI003F9DC5ED
MNADAIVMADRQNAALSGLSAAYTVYDRATHAMAAADEYQIDPEGAREAVAAAGLNFETSDEAASTELFSAAAKAAGYSSGEQFSALQNVTDRAYVALRVFFDRAVWPAQRLDEASYRAAQAPAAAALKSLLVALDNASLTSGCDFGYRNGSGAAAFSACPAKPRPVPSIELPSDQAGGPVAH